MRRFLFTLLQLTWGLPQTLLGFFFFLYHRARSAGQRWFHGALVTRWPARSSMSLGLFIFLAQAPGRCTLDGRLLSSEETELGVLVHEYGHCIQSLILGPLFLPLVGLPSLLWASLPAFRAWRRRRLQSYYSVYPENWANALGARASGQPSIGLALPASFPTQTK